MILSLPLLICRAKMKDQKDSAKTWPLEIHEKENLRQDIEVRYEKEW